MRSFIEEGIVVAIQLKDDKEIFGEWKGIVWDYEETMGEIGEHASKYIKIGRACHVVITAHQIQGGMIPQKTLAKVAENDSFSDEVLIKEDNILIIKFLTKGKGLYNLYLQASTGLSIPSGGTTDGGTPGNPLSGIGLCS